MRTTSALLVPLVLILVGGCTANDEPPQPGRPSEQAGAGPSSEPQPPESVRLQMLPPIVQPGKSPAPAAEVPVLVASVEPATADATVLLQRQEKGGWRTVAREQLDETGTARFDPETSDAGAPAHYRAAAVATGDAGTVTSDVVEPVEWQPVFGDEFDGTALDPTKWGYRHLGIYNPDGGRICSKSDESAVSVSGGTLNLQVRPDLQRRDDECRTPEDGTQEYYLNGHVSTSEHFAFTEGVAAARIKFQRGRGQHGAFWLQREGVRQVPGEPDESGAEIDIAEYFGEGYQKGGLASFVYYLNSEEEYEKVGGLLPRATRLLPEGDDWWRRYHVFSVEWTSEEYVFRVDGREIYRTDEGVSGVEQFLVLSLLSSDWELDKLDRSRLPSTMSVDWVRVWQDGEA